MPHQTHLDDSYRRDPETGALVVDVDLDRYADVFSDWDRGPLRRRDVHPDLLFFLKACSNDIPVDQPIHLVLFVRKQQRNSDKEEWIAAGLRNYFSFGVAEAHRDLRENRLIALRYVATAFAFLLLAYVLEPHWPRHLLAKVAIEGLIIGGWVFLWEAISALVFKNRDVRRRLKENQRFVDAPVTFEYEE